MPVKRGEQKRSQNDGSWRARGERWQLRVTIGGEQHAFTAATKEEARAKADLARSKYAAGVRLGKDREPLSTYLARWMENADLRPTTRRTYQIFLTHHIVPALGAIALGDLTPDDVQRLVQRKRGTLAIRSIRQMHAIIRKALNDAVDDRLRADNPAARTRLPRIPDQQGSFLTMADAHKLLAALDGDRLEALYTVALAMGLRQAEALGLFWDAVDLGNRTLTVRQQLQRVDRAWQFNPPKSHASRRTLPIPPECIPILQRHWQAMERERPSWKEPFDAPLVFRSRRGQPLHAAVVTHYFQRVVLPKAGLAHMRFHDLRHACLSLLIARGVHPRVVANIAGHSQISLAMNTYGHVLPEIERAAMEEMDTVLRGRLGQTQGHAQTGNR